MKKKLTSNSKLLLEMNKWIWNETYSLHLINSWISYLLNAKILELKYLSVNISDNGLIFTQLLLFLILKQIDKDFYMI